MAKNVDKKVRIVEALKSTVDGTYKIDKSEITIETVESSYQKYFALLNNLPVELKSFASLTKIVLQKEKYDIVWLGLKLGGIYLGKSFLPLLSSDWELEADFYEICCQMLNDNSHVSEC